MAKFTITNLDDSIIVKLQERANAHHRSVEAEARAILADTVRPFKYDTLAECIAAKSDIRAYTKRFRQTDSTEMIREDRDR